MEKFEETHWLMGKEGVDYRLELVEIEINQRKALVIRELRKMYNSHSLS